MVAGNEKSALLNGSRPSASSDSRHSCSVCHHLGQSLTRQSEVMERLVDLLPQLIAVNQALIEALTDKDEPEPSEAYLDGSPR